MRWLNLHFIAWISLLFVSETELGIAQEDDGVARGGSLDEQASSAACPDADGLGPSVITDICWDCIFPIQIAGQPITLGDGNIPARAANNPLCSCAPNCVGITVGMWEPAYYIELVKQPGCSPVLGGQDLGLDTGLQRGSKGDLLQDKGDSAFYHAHIWSFPVLLFADVFFEDACLEDGSDTLELLYLSELDPTWNNDELAAVLTPESQPVATPEALAACLVDAAAAETGEAIDALFWCVGSWGHLYPLAGHHLQHTSIPRNTSLLASRALAKLHRRGQARRHMGDDAVCNPVAEPFLPKTQYQMSVFHPVPEATSKHPTGRTTFRWGEDRMIPGSGEDMVYLIWRWNDCCRQVVCFGP